MGFNSGFKGLIISSHLYLGLVISLVPLRVTYYNFACISIHSSLIVRKLNLVTTGQEYKKKVKFTL